MGHTQRVGNEPGHDKDNTMYDLAPKTELTDDLAAARTFSGPRTAGRAGRLLQAETGARFTMVPGPENGTYIVGIVQDGVLFWIAPDA
jgi:hypothetical protein